MKYFYLFTLWILLYVHSYSQNPVSGTVSSNSTVLTVNGSNTTITQLGVQKFRGKLLWEQAVNDQLGIIGNDFRGREEIGSASFQRASNQKGIPDNLNFWYPQKEPRSSKPYSKKTLAGKVIRAGQVNIPGVFNDFDVNIIIRPNEKYMALINEGHRREYTRVMSLQWNLTAGKSGQPNCDDQKSIDQFSRVEAEVAEDFWPQGNRTFGRAVLTDLALLRSGKQICVYGPWIYDAGHCCQPEIHPAEQLWWSDASGNSKTYSLNVICDASQRFWWRKQMDNGTTLKPWGAPPIKGLFAIAFECEIPNSNINVAHAAKQFEVANISHHNVIEYPNADKIYNLIYKGKSIVSFIPHNNAFKVSFEHVGTIPSSPNKLRGFLVIETTVGVTTQIATSITVVGAPNTPPVRVNLPPNSTPEQAPKQYENLFFKKEKGHYYFTVTERNLGPTGTLN